MLCGGWVIEHIVKINVPDRLDKLLVKLVLLYRRLRYGYPFRRIPLTQGKFAIVDPDDYEWLNKYKWHVNRGANTYYACRNSRIGKKRVSIKMHREIFENLSATKNSTLKTHNYHRHIGDGLVVDHINHNGLDNRKANLRPATRSQNSLNKSSIKTKPSSSKYNGVSWYRRRKIWHVQIGLNGKYKFIGYFHDEIQAAKAYDTAAKKYHGDFAVLNFP